MTMPRKEHHVVPNPDGGWDVKRENAKRSSGHYDTKKEAMEVLKADKKPNDSLIEAVFANKDLKKVLTDMMKAGLKK